jgi:hypothetical protein
VANPALGVLHRLAPAARAPTPEAAADAVVALHATDPATVHLSVVARTAGPGAPLADVDRALYDDRTLVRVLAMRRTLWAVPVSLVPVVVAACGRAVAAEERRKVVGAVEGQGVADDGARFVGRLEDEALAALVGRGEATARELTDDVPDLARTIRLGGTSKWATEVSMATRVLITLTAEGRVTRSRPRGSWTATLLRYAPVPPLGDPVDPDDARAELARRWLAAFGPASAEPVRDLRWWAGWTVGATRRALADAGGGPPAAGDLGARAGGDAGPWAALVPSLDPTTMGWKERSWYLGDLGGSLFDANGNAGPTIWWSGRIVGGWAQRPGGDVATRLLVDVGTEGETAVDAEAARLQAWLDAGGAVVRPRFPTPLLKELCA